MSKAKFCFCSGTYSIRGCGSRRQGCDKDRSERWAQGIGKIHADPRTIFYLLKEDGDVIMKEQDSDRIIL